MAGHSHWAQIKHKKAIVDAKKGQLISKLIRAITIAAREGNNPETNYKLRAAIERAREFQVPLENIERAIKKGETKEDNLEEIIFEAYLEDVQILIKAITDNKNRTLGEIRHLLNKYGGRLAEPRSVIWNFQEKGVVVISKEDETKVLDLADLFEDIQEKDGDILLITNLSQLNELKDKLEKNEIVVKDSYLEFRPLNIMENISENLKTKANQLIEELLNLDDIEEVFTNLKD
ncbi:MAG: putative transcriptional regulatory protein [Candidatus Parcubacteria bacterium]|nr:MAG: putative transcriptional regulatory protein [Candidatus Parcubacteria bacterium]